MGTWGESLEKVKLGTANKAESIHAVTQWLYTDVASSTEGMYEAVSRRVVWLYPDGYALAVGTSIKPVFYNTLEKIEPGTTIPLPQSLQSQWGWHNPSNGWKYLPNSSEDISPSDLETLVETFSKTHGTPDLVLPWGYIWTESVIDQGEDYYDWYADDLEEGEENAHEVMFHLATALMDGTLAANSPWKIVPLDEDAALPYYSDFSKFQRFINRVGEEKLAILDLDQHCAGCSSGTYEYAVKADPELEGKEIFRTWGQNSEYAWLGDGSIYVEAWINDEATERALKQIATEEGLDMDLDDEEWAPTGSFEYES
jgi:hypothetical protein